MAETTVTGQNAALFLGSLLRADEAHAGVDAAKLSADARSRRPGSTVRLRLASTRAAWRPTVLPAARPVGRCEHRPAPRPRANRCGRRSTAKPRPEPSVA